VLLLSLSLATLVSCSQATPVQYVSLNLGIPAAALNSPVKGPLPDSTVLHMGITFKIDPKVLAEAGQQPLQPGQASKLGALAKSLGIDTELFVNQQSQRTDEKAWSQFPNILHCNNSWGTGGGNSSLFHRLTWQNASGVNNKYSQNDRQVPDVAAVADNLAIYFQGSWGAVGGTSAAAPIWAAGQALVNEDTIQRLDTFAYSPSLYYQVANKEAGSHAYFDITSGNNLYYPATAGWD
jgi:hypothetical protein